MESVLPDIPAKRYFTIGEVSELCGVKPYVLRYWEQEFTQLRPMKRRGNRRYYQHHEVLLIRRIRDLLYDKGFTISGARNRLAELNAAVLQADALQGMKPLPGEQIVEPELAQPSSPEDPPRVPWAAPAEPLPLSTAAGVAVLHAELLSIRELLHLQ